MIPISATSRVNDRSTALLLIAVALAGYGVYIAGYVPAMLVGQPVPLLQFEDVTCRSELWPCRLPVLLAGC
jgi:hypothetical protein